MSRTIVASGLPHDASEHQLRQLLCDYGDVCVSLRSHGSAHLEFEDPELAQAFREASCDDLAGGGQPVRIELLRDRDRGRDRDRDRGDRDRDRDRDWERDRDRDRRDRDRDRERERDRDRDRDRDGDRGERDRDREGGWFGDIGERDRESDRRREHRMPPPSSRSSDWICSKCDQVNFARRTACFTCHAE